VGYRHNIACIFGSAVLERKEKCSGFSQRVRTFFEAFLEKETRPMENEVTVKIPRAWMKGLPEEELTLKQIIRLGIYQYKVEPYASVIS